MADIKISELNSLAGADLVAADVVAVVDDSASETKKLTVSDLIANGTTLISDATIPSAKILFSAGAIDTAELAASSVETAKINDSAVTAAKLADNSSVTLVSTLPGSGDFTGQIALDTDDDKIYIWDGSAWDSVKGAGSINVVNGSTTGEVNIVASTSGDTVTISATLDDTTAAAQFLAGPTGAGGTVGYRAIIGTDLPTASTTAKGGVIVNGNGLTMSSDTIAIDNTVTAETSENHIVQYDANGLVTGGRAIIAADVPVATSTAVGVIQPGSGLGVTGAGELNHDNSVTAGTASKVTFDTEGHITGTESLVAADIPDLDASKITSGTVPTARVANEAITADKLADRSTATIAETTPAGGNYIGQLHLNSISSDLFLWDGNVWQPIGISVGEIVLAGTYDANTNLVATVTSEGTAVGYEVGSALPSASDSNKGYYVIVSEAGTGTSPAPTVALNPPDFLLSTGTAYTEIDVSDTVTAQQASNIQFTAAGNIASTNVQSALEELDTEKVAAADPTFTGTLTLGEDAVITVEGATDNDFETTLTVTDPTADRTITLPNVTGTVVTTGDTGSVTSTMITDGTIVNADISASAEIAVSKLANGTARQLLQTDVAGSGVEFTSNVDIPGTLDVTGAATLDSTLAVTGETTTTGVINADGKVKFPTGTAAAPSFYFGTDTDTGLYHSAADEISFATGGTRKAHIDSSGRLLLGTDEEGFSNADNFTVSDAGNAGITIRSGSTSLGTIAFSDATTSINEYDGYVEFDHNAQSLRLGVASSERLRIDSSGRVLIGTTTARGNFLNSTFDARLQVEGTDQATSTISSVANSASDNPMLLLGRSRGTSLGSNTVVQSGDNLGELIFQGSDGTQFVQAAAVTGECDGTPGADDMPGRLVFSTTADGAATLSERLRIDSSGQLGLGVTPASWQSSTKALQILSASLAVLNSKDPFLTNNAYWDGSNWKYHTTDAASSYYQLDGQHIYRRAASGTAGTNVTWSESMRIDSSGNVGIGTSSPAAALDIKHNSASTHLRLTESTSGNYAAFGVDGSDNLRIYVNNSERMRIASNGYVKAQSGRSYVQTSGSGTGDSDGVALIVDGNEDAYLWNYENTTLRFGTNNTEQMRIDSSGKVLIGSTAGSAHGDRLLQVGKTDRAATYISIVNSTSGSGALLFADTTSADTGGYRGQVAYDHSNDLMQFWTGASERMRIDSSGRLLVAKTSSSATSEDIEDSKGGIRAIPQNSKTAAYQLVAADVGKHVNITTGGVTVPSGVFSAGDAISIYNDSASNQTITQGSSVTLRQVGTANTGNRTLAQRGLCTVLCVASNEFVISGGGLS